MAELTMAEKLALAAQSADSSTSSSGTEQTVPAVSSVNSETVAGKSKSGSLA